MDRNKKIYLAYKRLAKNSAHIVAAIDTAKMFNLGIFDALAIIKAGKEGSYK